ncbi:MAG: hypothetical protein ACOYB8_04730 [Eubacteriaceae bacterium]|jgi:CBS domain containing-hemolysin-like protein
MAEKKPLTKKEKEEKKHKHWVAIVTVSTFFSTMLITYISDTLLASTTLLVSFIILIVIIAFGVLSDVVGVALTAANPQPFNAMAAKKIPGARTAVKMIRNAPRLSNVCNDVIGDICGIVSGATGVAIAAQLFTFFPAVKAGLISLIMSGCIAAITVGGKAIGKDLAMKNYVQIVTAFARSTAAVKGIFGGSE